MTNLNNNNLPKIETVAELKENVYKIKSSKLSAAARRNKVINKSGSNYLSENREDYGPCDSCVNSNNFNFKLKIRLENCMGSWKEKTVYNTDNARSEARQIEEETGFWSDGFLNYFSKEDRQKLVYWINSMIKGHEEDEGYEVDTEVCNKDKSSSWGGSGYKSYEQVQIMNFYTKP